ncbi:hypothetical protein VCRA2128O305_330002 [Vibrio crassostreae]|nr:hypothetical protein VCRA2118O236_350021 [Vibrio crassostreae]CAK2915285.1 hypothetical protein VCRA2118O237_360030 [Vibrio crassostreae]CAK2916127.1 hypothetical protein VCRA2118O238_360008 [Vibrio crassostreae]CAK2935712.1 hypothetical protein VCRA2120O252_370051 [Vibrio crassostreae]CAK2975261.1 hypothetical protein VCRA2133O313_330013 [Vibrio crassostreae]
MIVQQLKPGEKLNVFSKGKAKFYIAGPVSSVVDGNYQSFKEVAVQISEAGHIALYTSILPKGLSEADYMKFAHSMLEVCDVVVLLPRWSLSAGATAEYYWADKLNKPVVRSEHLDVILRHWNIRGNHMLYVAANEVRAMIQGGDRPMKPPEPPASPDEPKTRVLGPAV